MKKIGIFGGTFNPVHLGHLSLATQLCDAVGAEQVLWIPTAVPPHKSAVDLAPEEDRLAMCRLAAQTDARFCVSDIEIRRRGKSYTAETVKELSEAMPGAQLYLFMGADMFLSVQNWYCPEVIFQKTVLVAAARRQGEEPLLREQQAKLASLGAKSEVVPVRVLQISSTEIREKLRSGEAIGSLMPESVYEYVLQKRLYVGGHEDD